MALIYENTRIAGKGAPGPANNLSIGTVETGTADATITGMSPNQTLNLTIPIGPPNVLSIGTVTKGAEAGASITGTSPSQVLNLTLPKGDAGAQGIQGVQGDIGPANVLSIGTVVKGENAGATITGTSPSQILNLTLPKGDKGDKGDKGEKGDAGGISDKATGEDINIGTNDDKAVTPKAIEDSNLIRSTNDTISNIIALTREEYEELTELEKVGKLFNITDDRGSFPIVSVSTSTAASTAAKVGVGPTGYIPTEGDIIALTLSIANTVASPTLNINGSGAKNIRIAGADATASVFKNAANGVVYLVYDGTYYNMLGANMSKDANTTYSEISETNIKSDTSSTTGLITGRRMKAAIDNRMGVYSIQKNGTDGTGIINFKT